MLSTVHSAKGLEWQSVHLLAAYDGNFPADLAAGTSESIAEERRLMYVALTRARRSLSIYVPRRYYRRPQGRDDGHGYGKASRFLTPAVQALCDVTHLPDDAPRGPFARRAGAAAANRRVGRRAVHVDQGGSAAEYCWERMAVAPERVGVASFLQQLAREREDYALPPRLRELAERFIHRSLELLFPHFAAEVGGRAGDVADELAALRTLLADALRLPEAHCADPDDVVERFFTALPDIREALLLDAQAIYDGDPAAHSVDEVILAYPGFFATAVYRLAHQLQGCEVPLVPRVLTETAHRDTGIDIHPAAQHRCVVRHRSRHGHRHRRDRRARRARQALPGRHARGAERGRSTWRGPSATRRSATTS